MNCAIVIPCYNEAGNLPEMMARVAAITAARPDISFLLVDNGSRDGSLGVMDRLLAETGARGIRRIRVEVNQGYGHGILAGLRACESDALGWTHADLQTDPMDAVHAFDLMKAQPDPGACLVKGKRVRRPFADALFTRAMGWVARALLGVWLDDINGQPKVFARGFLDRMGAAPLDFSLDVYALWLAKKSGLRLLEVPVVYAPRKHGVAKGGGSFRGKIPLMKRSLAYLFKLRKTLAQGEG